MSFLGQPSLFTDLLVTLGVFTSVLLLLFIYRVIVGMKEDDQLILSQSEAAFDRERNEAMVRSGKVTRYIRWVGIATGAMALVVGGMWITDVVKHF